MKEATTCIVECCTRPTKSRGLCNTHYVRQYRTGTTASDTPIRTWIAQPDVDGTVNTTGYVITFDPRHPLAGATGLVSAHRVALYAKLGPGAHNCHWCAKRLYWRVASTGPDAICTDHLDFCRTNNDPANLVPVCRACSSARTRRSLRVSLPSAG